MLTSPLSYLTVSDHPIILSQQQYYCIDLDPEDTQRPAEVLSLPTARPSRRFSPEAGLSVKKANHNATERDRRKKVNSLFSSLRSLLPLAEQKKKLSIPAMISRVLKYIPELQAQIQLLTQEKQRLLSCVSDDRRCCGIDTEQRRDDPSKIAGLTVESTCWRSEREAVIQICQGGNSDKDISEVLRRELHAQSTCLGRRGFKVAARWTKHSVSWREPGLLRLRIFVANDRIQL